MIKGILALFRTGIIFNPMVLLGILLGLIAMCTLGDTQLHAFYTDYRLYMLMFLIAALYVYFFRRRYYLGGLETDWNNTLQTMVGYFLIFVISFIFSMLFIMVMSFGGAEPMPNYEAAQLKLLEQGLQETPQELQQNYQAIMKGINPTGQ